MFLDMIKTSLADLLSVISGWSFRQATVQRVPIYMVNAQIGQYAQAS